MVGSANSPLAASIVPTFQYKDARAAIAWLREAFGLTVAAVHGGPDGVVAHAELAWQGGMIMLGTARTDNADFGSPGAGSVYVIVDDVDAHHARAVAAGASVVRPLTDQDHGSRDYTARDPEGNTWTFGTYRPTL